MGKGRKKRGKHNAQKSVPKKKGMNRRKFLKYGLAGVVAASTVPAIYFGRTVFHDDRWAFLEEKEREFYYEGLDYHGIIDRYVPLGLKKKLEEGSKELEDVRNAIESTLVLEIKKAGFDLGSEYKASATRQEYGIPAKLEVAQSLVDYCKKAVDYLHSRISGLDKREIHWTQVKEGDDFERDFNTRGFAVHSYYDMQRVEIVNKRNPDQALTRGRHKHKAGGAFWSHFDESQSLDNWYLIISANKSAIASPFSEVIPITTTRRTFEEEIYRKGYEEGVQADEAVSEGISHHLSQDIIRELNIPDGLKSLEESHRKFMEGNSQIYRYVPNAIRWIEKNSIQAAFDLYMESPKKFMEAIKNA